MRRLGSVLTIAALLAALAGAQPVRAANPSPWHTIAQTTNPISATGYRARIQVRAFTVPAAEITYSWAGGYLADGTFVQSGILQPHGWPAQAFVWVQLPGMDCCAYTQLPEAQAGDWYDFEAKISAGSWLFTVRGSNGVTRVQANVPHPSKLSILQVDHESWMNEWGPIPTGAMRAIGVLNGSTWSVPHLVHSPTGPQCGTEDVIPTPGLNLVFKSAVGASCYRVLS